MHLPMGLEHALESGACVLFVGAGAGHYFLKPDGSKAPDARALAAVLADKYKIDLGGDDPDLAAVSELVEVRRGRTELEATIAAELAALEPADAFQRLIRRGWKGIFTTNYDNMIERTFELDAEPQQVPVSFSVTADLVSLVAPGEVPIYHLHGSLAAGEEGRRLIITESDYTRYDERRRMLFNLFKLHYATDTVVYVGYSHDDANWRTVTAGMRLEFAPSEPPPAYRIAPSTPTLKREVLESQGLHTVDADIQEFVDALASLQQPTVGPPGPDSYPEDLRAVAQRQPVAMARLTQSWDFVNGVDFSSLPNTSNFFRGVPPNWGLIGEGINFERDIEEPLVQELLDYLTAPTSEPKTHTVLGAAGYGISTLLMAVSAWLARAKAAPILYLRPGSTIRPGDIEFAARRLGVCCFVVDNASDHADELLTAHKTLRAQGLPSLFLLGDRLNEWRARRVRLGTEWALEALSDPEIERLLAALDQNDELGVLKDLSDDMQFAAVKVKNQQELLVTLREVTEGRAFEAIIESEYYGIDDERARRLYLTVACFSRARAPMRTDLASKVLGTNIAELYTEVVPQLEGVLRFQSLPRGDETLMTRHHVIGDMVWQRCGDRVQRQRLATACISELNLTFGVDAKAFESLTRSEQLIDDFESLEAKTSFFEAALQKSPDNAFIRQQYARMLRRAGQLDAAVRQIDEALRMSPGSRPLMHTRGVLLRDLALAAQNEELGRRWLSQSEEAFRSCLAGSPRDEYAYQSLAELYIMWAEKIEGQLASLDYVSKAEEVVQEALTRVRDAEGMYVVSARIEDFVGNRPAQMEALGKAIAANPEALVARYLLGIALLRSDRLDEAGEVLEAGLRLKPDHPRLARAYALVLERSGDESGRALAVLHQAALEGSRDHRFVALHGGMLEMQGKLKESADVFRAAKSRSWTIAAKHVVGYEPTVGRWRGRVARHLGGYAFLAVPGQSDVMCPARNFPPGLVEGSEVTFKIVFDVRGPRAQDVALA